MAAYGWRKSRSVSQGLAQEPHLFSFLQTVRLLEAMQPERAAVGESVDPELESVRFESRVRLDFPASEIDAVELPAGRHQPARVRSNILGIAGLLGPLPPPFTELILQRRQHQDRSLADFLDLFNHRLLSIFYRARKKFRPAVTRKPPDEGAVARTLFALIGLGTPGLRHRLRLPDRSLLRYTGLLVGRSRSMIGLQQTIRGHFGVPARVLPFRGGWIELSADQRTRIGRRGENHRLGDSAVLGSRLWDQQSTFELELYDLTERQLLDLLPTAAGYASLCSLVRFYVGDEFDFRLRLRLRAGKAPELRLGRAGDSRLGWSARLGERDGAQPLLGRAGGARLGWTSWLGATGDTSDVACSLTLRGA